MIIFIKAKTKSQQGVMAVWSLKLAFTEMLMHSGTILQDIYMEVGWIFISNLFLSFLSWIVSLVKVLEYHCFIKRYFCLSINALVNFLISHKFLHGQTATLVSLSLAERDQRAVPFADCVITSNISKSDSNYGKTANATEGNDFQVYVKPASRLRCPVARISWWFGDR